MKRKFDQNQPTPDGSFQWRMVLGGALLCLLTSLNSFGQTTADYQARLTMLLEKGDNAREVASPEVLAVYNAEVAALQFKLGLQVTIPGAPGYVAPPTSEEQIAANEAQIAALQAQLNAVPLTLTKAQIAEIMTQIEALAAENNTLGNQNNNPVPTPSPALFSVSPPAEDGVSATDPHKVP